MSLQAVNTSVRFADRVVLDAVSLTLKRGEVTAVIGPNGAGKSTLMACLAGLRRLDAGDILLDARSLLSLSPRERARRIALLPQSQEIAWPVDVETLVGLGRLPHSSGFGGELGKADLEIVRRALEEVGMTEFAHRIATTLSGGERGRALLARALAGGPDWLLADEPLTGLDPGHQFDACDLLRRAARRGAGVVLTLHDLALASRAADRVIVLADGRIAADGPPDEALTPTLLAEVYGVEARVTRTPNGLSIEMVGRRAQGRSSR